MPVLSYDMLLKCPRVMLSPSGKKEISKGMVRVGLQGVRLTTGTRSVGVSERPDGSTE
jgi:hypothetical protein